jgi:hypothetical protein
MEMKNEDLGPMIERQILDELGCRSEYLRGSWVMGGVGLLERVYVHFVRLIGFADAGFAFVWKVRSLEHPRPFRVVPATAGIETAQAALEVASWEDADLVR